MSYIMAMLTGYLLGSFPSAFIFARKYGVEDIREVESGTMGTYNVLRNAGKKAAGLTLIFDLLKGILAIAAVSLLNETLGGEQLVFIAAYGAVIGHMFPVYVGFAGGKSLAVFSGCVLLFSYTLIAIIVISWLIFYKIIGKIAVSSLLAFSILPPLIVGFYAGSTPFFWFLLASGITIGLRHIPQVLIDIEDIKK